MSDSYSTREHLVSCVGPVYIASTLLLSMLAFTHLPPVIEQFGWLPGDIGGVVTLLTVFTTCIVLAPAIMDGLENSLGGADHQREE